MPAPFNRFAPPAIFLFAAFTIAVPHVADADVLFFPAPDKTLSAETMPYMPMLHTGVESDDFYTRGRFGTDFPIIGYDFSSNNRAKDNDTNVGTNVSQNKSALGTGTGTFGITAATWINMIPTSGMKFPVDNFYATLALHISGVYGDNFSWRFYPIYHVSAHLADGYPSDIVKKEVRAVSSEMIKGEVYYKLFGDMLELGAGGGWYYHVCAQDNLKYRGEASALLTPATFGGGTVAPYILIRGENVFRSGHNPGVEASAGAMALKGKRGFGLSIRYFNHLHRSYYFNEYEKGWGLEYTFVY